MGNKPVSHEEGKTLLLQSIREKDFQQQIIEIASAYGWLVYHTYDSRRSQPGYPDLTLVHPTYGFIVAELKTEKGRLRPAQQQWIAALQANGVECYIWRPRDLDFISKRLAVTETGVSVK